MGTVETDRARENIRKALALREKTSFEVSLSLSRNRTYLDDFLRGRKQSIGAGFLQNLANHLRINQEILSGNLEWSEDPAVLFGRPSPSAEETRAELEWHAATSRVEAIMENLSKVKGEAFSRAVVELQMAQREAQVAFKHMMLSEKNVLVERQIEVKERDSGVVSIQTYINQLGVDYKSVVTLKIFDNALRNGDDGGIGRGDLVFVDTRDSSVVSGGIFAIEEAGTLYVRRIEYIRSQANPTISCRATNSDFIDFEVKLSDVIIVGRVIGHLRPV